MNELGKELSALLKDGNLGHYTYCKVDQIVLLTKSKGIINYFTHIDFSSKYTQAVPFNYLISKPITVSDFRIAISSYTIPVKEFVSLYIKAAQTGKWEFDGESIIIDDAFVSHKKFIPDNDPAVSQYNCFVPVEYALYGSNFMGNYYLTELYSKKAVLNEIIGVKEQASIQKIISSCKLNYRLDKLTDRIGNVVCKFNIESFKSKPILLGAEHGIGFEFEYSKIISRHGLSLSVVQEHDGIIYTNNFIGKFRGKDLKIPPNQCKTQISIIDRKNSLTLFYGVYDYRSYSGNYSQITAPSFCTYRVGERILHHNDHDEKIELFNTQPLGEINTYIEMSNADERKKHLYDHIVYDSTNEQKFAEDLDTNNDVAVYVKLPDGFYISTPVGHYNPDWAIAFYEGSVKHIYFIAETKGSMNSMQLRLIEESKIHCAREHFKAISSDNVVYDVVDSYQALLDKVMR